MLKKCNAHVVITYIYHFSILTHEGEDNIKTSIISARHRTHHDTYLAGVGVYPGAYGG